MRIYFRSKKLEKTCSNEMAMQTELGAQRAIKLRRRLMELMAADSLSDISHLPPSRLHELKGKRAGQFSVDLEHPYRLLFIPAHDPIPRNDDGGVDLEKVVEIEVLGIFDTH